MALAESLAEDGKIDEGQLLMFAKGLKASHERLARKRGLDSDEDDDEEDAEDEQDDNASTTSTDSFTEALRSLENLPRCDGGKHEYVVEADDLRPMSLLLAGLHYTIVVGGERRQFDPNRWAHAVYVITNGCVVADSRHDPYEHLWFCNHRSGLWSINMNDDVLLRALMTKVKQAMLRLARGEENLVRLLRLAMADKLMSREEALTITEIAWADTDERAKMALGERYCGLERVSDEELGVTMKVLLDGNGGHDHIPPLALRLLRSALHHRVSNFSSPPFDAGNIVPFACGHCFDAEECVFRRTRPSDRATVAVPYPAPLASDPEMRSKLMALLREIHPNPNVLRWRLGVHARALSCVQPSPHLLVSIGRPGSGRSLEQTLVQHAWGRDLNLAAHKDALTHNPMIPSRDFTFEPLKHKRHVCVDDVESFDTRRVNRLLAGDSLRTWSIDRRRARLEFPLRISTLELLVEADTELTFEPDDQLERRMFVCRYEQTFVHVESSFEADALAAADAADSERAGLPARAFLWGVKVEGIKDMAPEFMKLLTEVHTEATSTGGEFPSPPEAVTVWTQAVCNTNWRRAMDPPVS